MAKYIQYAIPPNRESSILKLGIYFLANFSKKL